MNKFLILILFTFFGFNTSIAQTLSFSPKFWLDKANEKGNKAVADGEKIKASLIATGTELIKYLPANYVKDGTVDYSKQVQQCLNENKNVVFPDFPVLVDKDIVINTGQRIYMKPKGEIRRKSTSLEKYSVFEMKAVNNIYLIGVILKGDLLIHQGSSGEYGMGFDIRGCSNVFMLNCKSTEMWGDGIYLGATNKATTDGSNNKTNTNIVIADFYGKECKRNIVSLISGNGVYMFRPYLALARYSSPFNGLDMEPNNLSDELKDIFIVDPFTEKNGAEGIQVCFTQWYRAKVQGEVKKDVSIMVFNHKDAGSKSAILISAPKNQYKASLVTVTGFVRFVDPIWEKGSANISKFTGFDGGYKLSIIRPTIKIEGIAQNRGVTENSIKSTINSGVNYELTF